MTTGRDDLIVQLAAEFRRLSSERKPTLAMICGAFGIRQWNDDWTGIIVRVREEIIRGS